MLQNLVEYGASIGYFGRLKLGRCVAVQLHYSVCPSEQQQDVQIQINSNDHRMANIQYERPTHQIFIIYVYSFTSANNLPHRTIGPARRPSRSSRMASRSSTLIYDIISYHYVSYTGHQPDHIHIIGNVVNI